MLCTVVPIAQRTMNLISSMVLNIQYFFFFRYTEYGNRMWQKTGLVCHLTSLFRSLNSFFRIAVVAIIAAPSPGAFYGILFALKLLQREQDRFDCFVKSNSSYAVRKRARQRKQHCCFILKKPYRRPIGVHYRLLPLGSATVCCLVGAPKERTTGFCR
jgi:hypothetical protein